MKVIVTIPAYNEETSIADVIQSIPRKLSGVKTVKVLVIDDGSTDNTFATAKNAGADYVLQNVRNRGLAYTFQRLLKEAISLDADIIVNTDADNQYNQAEIAQLIKPIIAGQADIVNGGRQVHTLTHMPLVKKYGNRFGSWILAQLTGLAIQDASSGFRAYSREAAMQLHLTSDHTYTHETLIQAAYKKLRVQEVPIQFHQRRSDKSKLIRSVWSHITKSAATIVRTVLMYQALKVFVTLGTISILIGILGGMRFLYFFLSGTGEGHVQSLILSSILINFGFTSCTIGFLADLLATNRKLLEQNYERFS